MSRFNGLGMGMGNLSMLSNAPDALDQRRKLQRRKEPC